MENIKQKGIIYCRVSSQEQVSGTSLEGQEKSCRDYAGSKGIEVAKVFVEKGESATAANRTELIKALDYCREHKGEINAFIVWKIDRFARNLTDHYALQAQLAKFGSKLHSVTEPMIQEGAVGKMTEAVLAGYAQFENDIRKQRCEGGMQRKIAEGIWPWNPPIGYIHSKKRTDRRKTLPDEADPERFLLIQKALKLYAKGNHSMVEITNLLNQWGMRTRTGRPVFVQMIDKILTDKFYAGILVNPWTKEEFTGKHEPMVTYEEFEIIQEIKNGVSRNKNRNRLIYNPDFPLRRTVLCTCGERMTAGWRTGRKQKHAYYNCDNKKCQHHSHGIRKEELETGFIEFLRTITPTEPFLRVFEATTLDSWKTQHAEFKQERQHYEKELKQLEEKKAQLIQMRMSDEISQEEFLRFKDDIDNRITGIKISRNEAKADESDIEAVITFAVNFLRDLASQWQSLPDVKQKQRLQRLVLPQGITYDKTTQSYCTAVLSHVFTQSRDYTGNDSDLVAGTGIAPVSQGYEPREVLLLHPAKPLYVILFGL